MAKLNIKAFSALSDAEAFYLTRIDAAAHEAREPVLESQSMIYGAKLKEALQYPDGNSFPWLEIEAKELGKSLQEVADSIIEARKKWEAKEVKRESKRLGFKAAIRKATTAAEMHRIVANANFE